MSPVAVFLVGIGLTGVCAFAVVWYLKPYLYDVLVDLCGTPQRAGFWTAFSTVTLYLTPLVFAMHYRPDPSNAGPVAFQLGSQVELALLGLLISIVLLAVVLAKFIPER